MLSALRRLALSALFALAERDRRHRDAIRLSQLDPHLRRDIGLCDTGPAWDAPAHWRHPAAPIATERHHTA